MTSSGPAPRSATLPEASILFSVREIALHIAELAGPVAVRGVERGIAALVGAPKHVAIRRHDLERDQLLVPSFREVHAKAIAPTPSGAVQGLPPMLGTASPSPRYQNPELSEDTRQETSSPPRVPTMVPRAFCACAIVAERTRARIADAQAFHVFFSVCFIRPG